MGISIDQYEKAFLYSAEIIDGTSNIAEIERRLARETGMDTGNARLYLTAFSAMRRGEPYQYSIRDAAVEHALEGIYQSNGTDGLRHALVSIGGYLQRYKETKGELRPSLRERLERWYRLV